MYSNSWNERNPCIPMTGRHSSPSGADIFSLRRSKFRVEMLADKLRLLIYLVASSLLFLVGCTRVTQTDLPQATEQLPTTTATERAPYRATPAANEIAAGICAEPESEVVTVTIFPDIPDPRCLKVKPEQKLRVINQTHATLDVALGEFKAEIEAGSEVFWDAPFGEYLEPGVHYLLVAPCCGPEIWLEGN